MKKIKGSILLFLLIGLNSCVPEKFAEQANQKFGDQHFKTAIALIELHKIRYGEYPGSLDSLTYLGDWDQIAFSSVRYTKHPDGYELDLLNGWMGKPEELEYPPEFWSGLGLKQSNLMKIKSTP